MDRVEHLLWILAEEAAAVAQRASKAARFGLSETQPGQPFTNAERIMHEWHDLLAAMEMLMDAGPLNPLPDPARVIAAKKAKVEKFLRYSAECGTLSGTPQASAEESLSVDEAALESLRTKISKIAPRFECMSEPEFGAWVDSLEINEFIEFIRLNNEGIGREIRNALAKGAPLVAEEGGAIRRRKRSAQLRP